MKALFKKLLDAYKTRSWRAGAYSVFAAILAVAIAVAVNLVVSALPASSTRLDMTENKLYSISPGTEQILAALDEDVDIYWLVQSDQADSTMEQVLSKYAEYEHVSVTKVDPVRYPGFAGDYTDETVTNNSLIVASADRSMYIPYEDVWTYSDYEMYYYYLYSYGEQMLDTFAGEGLITSAVSYVTSDEQPVMYILTGHGEAGASDAVLDAIALENVQTQTLNLLTAEAVPEDCAVLALMGPVTDITDRELAMIEDYMAAGGQMLITTEYAQEEMPNFAALLAENGLTLINGLVLESDSRYYNYGYVDLVLPSLGGHEITEPLEGYTVMMPDAQGLVIDTEDTDLTVTPLLTSSATSYIKTDLEGLDSYDKADGDPTGSFLLGAATENSQTGGRLVVFCSTLFMEPEYSDMVSGANEDLFLNGVDWLCQLEGSISIHPKTLSSDYLTFAAGTANVVRLLLVAVVPVLFLAAGVVIFVRRRRR